MEAFLLFELIVETATFEIRNTESAKADFIAFLPFEALKNHMGIVFLKKNLDCFAFAFYKADFRSFSENWSLTSLL